MAVMLTALLIVFTFYAHNKVWYTAAAYEAALAGNGRRGTDALQVYDIADPKHPFLVSADEKIRSPKGLGVDAAAGRLFVCCKGGLKVYDLAEPGYPVWVDDLTNLPEVGSIDAYDVIPRGGLLILIGADGLYQFDYTEENLSFVSKIDLRTL